MAKNKTPKPTAKTPADGTTLSEENLEQIVGGNQSAQGQAKGKGKAKGQNSPGNVGGITPTLGDGSVRSISDGTSNTVTFGEKQ